jgi:plasmid stability protein
MRTTLTLDDDVAHELRQRARRSGATFKAVVNEAIRAGLQADRRPSIRRSRFTIAPRSGGFRPGVDLLHLNRLNDELEVEAVVDEAHPSARG